MGLLTITMEMKTQVDCLRQNHFQNGRSRQVRAFDLYTLSGLTDRDESIYRYMAHGSCYE